MAFENGHPDDKVQITINHPALRKGSFYIPFRKQNELNGGRILGMWERLYQSDASLSVDSQGFEIQLTRAKRPKGRRPNQGRWKHVRWMEKHSGHGGCFIHIKNMDNLCLPRAIVTAKARIDKEMNSYFKKNWNSIRQGRKIQECMAKGLIKRANLENHSGEWGENELQKLQNVLEPDGYQIKVFSSSCLNFMTYQGPVVKDKVLHIYHDCDENGENGHYMVLTRPHVLFSKQHFCDKCNHA